MSALVTQLRSDLTVAMRSRDTSTVRLVRTVLAAISNAEALHAPERASGSPTASGAVAGAHVGVGSTDVARRELSEQDVRAVISSERDERLQAADAMAAGQAAQEAARLRAEADALVRYLEPGSPAPT